MAKTLVIVESPAKAKTIKKFLGSHYTVKASVGHIIDLPKSKMGVDIDNDFEPRYITIRGKGPILNEIKKEAKKSKKILLATDIDREGEAISWHLANALNIDEQNSCRIVFNEITKSAIKNAVKNPQKIDLNLVNAQQARRVLDRLVGYNLSPLLWKKLRKGLSAGRVQSVATKMIKDREDEIKKFIPEEYWSLELEVEDAKQNNMTVQFYKDDNGEKELKSKEKVQQIIDYIDGKHLIVSDVTKGEKKRNPYDPFTTSTLQQEASNRIGFATRKTMAVAQQLYEGIDLEKEGTVGLITYLRTDSKRIGEEANQHAINFIKNEYGIEYVNNPKVTNRKKKEASIQDAHEAIRPTDVMRTPISIKNNLSNDQYKLYKLIWERFVASRMSPATFDTINATLSCDGYLFKANGSAMKFEGFFKVYSYATRSKDQMLPELAKDQTFHVINPNPKQHFTQPPARYTEASLVKTMEDLGIGRPSTYSPTISTILSRGYVVKDGKNLKPTELGILVTTLLEDYFSKILDIHFTAELEKRLDSVEDGQEEWKEIIREFYTPFHEMIEHADQHVEEVDFVEESDELCETCGEQMLIKYGRYGKFLACSKYPECTNTKPFIKKIGLPCPKCDVGEVVERKSKKGRLFYGCNQFPECRFVSWSKPVEERCPNCSEYMTIKRLKKGDQLVCSNKECAYKRKLKAEEQEKYD